MHSPNRRILFRYLTLAMAVLFLLAARAIAAADPPPAPDVDASAWIRALYDAVVGKQWGVVAGVVLIGIVYPLRLWGPRIFKTQFGGLVLAMLVSLAGTMGITLAVGAPVTLSVVISALSTAATAAGLWEWIKAHVPGGQALADAATRSLG